MDASPVANIEVLGVQDYGFLSIVPPLLLRGAASHQKGVVFNPEKTSAIES